MHACPRLLCFSHPNFGGSRCVYKFSFHNDTFASLPAVLLNYQMQLLKIDVCVLYSKSRNSLEYVCLLCLCCKPSTSIRMPYVLPSNNALPFGTSAPSVVLCSKGSFGSTCVWLCLNRLSWLRTPLFHHLHLNDDHDILAYYSYSFTVDHSVTCRDPGGE